MITGDFKEFIELLNLNKVKYLVVGGYALALHGHPRYTKDIDIWILPDPENAERIVKTLLEFGFSSLKLDTSDFLESGNVIQLGYPPNRIDILTSADGVNFDECYTSRIHEVIDGVTVDFIDLENLIRNKTATGRLQDLADLESLQQ